MEGLGHSTRVWTRKKSFALKGPGFLGQVTNQVAYMRDVRPVQQIR